MSMVSRFFSIFLSLFLMFLIIELVRRRKLREKYALLWLVTGGTILVLALFDKLLMSFIALLGIELPINGMLFLGTFFIIVINLHFSIVISHLTEENRKLAQRIALWEMTGSPVSKGKIAGANF